MEDESDKGEKAPLVPRLVHNEHATNKSTNGRIPLSVLMVAFTGFAQLFVAGMSTYNLQQYAYARFKKIDFPDALFNFSNDGGNPLCGSNVSTNSTQYKMEAQVQKSSADWMLYNSISSGVPTLFSSIILPSLSDRYGRKLLLPIPLVGSLVTNLIVALAFYLKWNMYIITALLSISSVSGTWVTSVALIFAYVADVTSGKSRTFTIAIVEIIDAAGFVVSVFASGFLIKNYGFIVPQLVSAAISLISIIIVLSCVPESLTGDKKQKQHRLFQHIKSAIGFYTKKYLDNKSTVSLRKKYIICIGAFSFVSLGTMGRNSVEILYQLGPPFCWDSIEVSNWSTYRTLVQHVVGIIGIKLFQFCINEEKIATIGGISSVGYFVMEGLAKNKLHLYLVPVIGCFNLITVAMLRSIMSKMTPAHLQGSLFASIAMFENVFVMVGSIIGNAIYRATVDVNRSFVFYVLAGANGFALLLFIYLCFETKVKNQDNIDRTVNISKDQETT